MFDIGFGELLVIAVIGLLVIGPKRMPEAIRVLGYWLGKLRRAVHNARQDMEREFGLDDIRRDLHNQALLSQLEKERNQIEQSLTGVGTAGITPIADRETDPDSSVVDDSVIDDSVVDDCYPSDTVTENASPNTRARVPLSEAEELETLQAFEDFEKEFGITADGNTLASSETPKDKQS